MFSTRLASLRTLTLNRSISMTTYSSDSNTMRNNRTISLYVKKHTTTGLSYFGQTTAKDPHKYKGSGVYWRNHLKVHGNLVETKIIATFTDKEGCKKFAKQFSLDNNIVNSIEWANLKIETIDGGWDHINSLPNEVRARWSADARALLTEEQRTEIDKKKAHHKENNYWFGKDRSGENNPRFGVHDDYETYEKISEANKDKMVVKDSISGDIIGFIDKNHPNCISGVWVSNNLGKKRTDNHKKDRSLLSKRLGLKPPSSKGKLWWNDGSIVIRSKICPGDNFTRGRKLIP